MTPLRESRASAVFDALAAYPSGLTLDDLARLTGMPVGYVRRAMRDLRIMLGDDDTLFVVADPQGAREQWLYRLLDASAVVDEEQSYWYENRIMDTESRIETMAASMAAAKRATNPRTVLGRKAVMLELGLRHLLESLRALGE